MSIQISTCGPGAEALLAALHERCFDDCWNERR